MKEGGGQKSPVQSGSAPRDRRDAPAGTAVSGAEGLLGLASSLGNAGFSELARDARAEGGLAALIARSAGHASNRSIARLARDMSARKLLRQVPPGGGGEPPEGAPRDAVAGAADFLRTHMGDLDDYAKDPLRQGRDMEALLRRIARRHPGLAAEATRLADLVREERAASETELGALTNRATDVLRRSGGGGNTPSPRKLEDQLRRVARGGGPHATEAGALADQMGRVRRRLNEIASGVPANYTPPPTKTMPTPRTGGSRANDKPPRTAGGSTPPGGGGGAAPSTGGGATAKTGAGTPAKGAGAGGTTVPDAGHAAGGGAPVRARPPTGTSGTTVPDAGHAAGGGARVRPGPPTRTGGEIDDHAGPDITAEERAAMAMPSNMIAGPGDWSLTWWLMQKLIFARFEEAAAEREREHVKQQIATQLEGQAVQTMGLQMRGDIAYAQVSTRTTQGYVSVLELTRLVVSPWFKQDYHRDTDAIGAVTTIDETYSFAITLHPRVKAWAVELLTNRIKAIDAHRQGTGGSAQLRTERDELVTCRHLVTTKEVSAFSMLPGTCHKYLPMGTPPPSG